MNRGQRGRDRAEVEGRKCRSSHMTRRRGVLMMECIHQARGMLDISSRLPRRMGVVVALPFDEILEFAPEEARIEDFLHLVLL